ncbi:hypothetical protein [Ekhidna sp.]|uniref:hypothetical protein n=1 Tax=Ekhidna sp. TaxID=2608089 RepID=UPI003514C59F
MAQRTDSKEGILAGTIGLYEGNCMPGPGVTPCEPKPIAATILITQLAESFDEALLVKQLRSNEEGVYSTSLPPGQYSLFLKDGDEIVCTLIQCPDKCICHPFEIKSDSTTIVDANLDHATW